MALFLTPSKTAAAVSAGFAFAFMLAATVGSVATAQAASQYVVISAEPAIADFPAGKVLGLGDTIEVPENATVTLLGEDGSVVAIPGHATVTVTEDALETTGESAEQAEKNRSTLSKLATLLAGNSENASSLGVSRGFNAKKEVKGLANPWVLSIHESAQGCVLNEPIHLGRTAATDTVLIEVENKGEVATLDWPAGESTIELPASISPASEELAVKAGGKTAFIRLSLIPDDVNADDPMAVLGWMVEEGCDGQALAFTRLLVHQAQ